MTNEKFYEYHPGFETWDKLFKIRESCISLLCNNPEEGIKYLKNEFRFGQLSDFWDDSIFHQVVEPALQNICKLPLQQAIDLFSRLSHRLVLPYIRRDEEPSRFRRAFWNVHQYGRYLSGRLFIEKSNHLPSLKSIKKKCDSTTKSILFLFKGSFELAHAEFFREFLVGAGFFKTEVSITLLLIDDSGERISKKGLEHIEFVSFSAVKSTYQKLDLFYRLISDRSFDHMSWISVTQDLSLYMGSKLVPSQSYWSMKYHSIIMDSIDKYAGLGFGGDSFVFDDIEWFRGRAFPDLSLPLFSRSGRLDILRKYKIPDNSFVVGAFVRSEKLNNPEYWELLKDIIDKYKHVHVVIASQNLPPIAEKYLSLPTFASQFHHLGWINTKFGCQLLDLYLDSFPRGSCLTILEAIQASVPIVMFNTPHNQESSALPYLQSATQNTSLPAGVLEPSNKQLYTDYTFKLIESHHQASALQKSQKLLLKKLTNRNKLYAKDYLNYFLDTNFSVNAKS